MLIILYLLIFSVQLKTNLLIIVSVKSKVNKINICTEKRDRCTSVNIINRAVAKMCSILHKAVKNYFEI